MITDSNYRDAFKNFLVLLKLKTVVFGLSGSIPPNLYPTLCQLTRTSWKVLRTPSSRKELKYQVVKVKSEGEMDAAIIAYLNSKTGLYCSKERAIVFCRTKNEACVLAQRLKVAPYHAVLAEDEGKNLDTMGKWLAGENLVMVSTSILGCGFDYGHIRDVVHRGPAYSMLDQYQEDSRGGRDGLECRATTFIVENHQYPSSNSPYDLGSRILSDSMKEVSVCFRTAPTLYLDGRSVQCISLPGASFCGNCDPPPRQQPRSFPPPRRSQDIFDPPPPPRLDLRNLLGVKRKHSTNSQTSSGSMNTSPIKRRRTPLQVYTSSTSEHDHPPPT